MVPGEEKSACMFAWHLFIWCLLERTLKIVAVVFFRSERKESSLLDSLDWSKKYEVLSMSRLYLSSLGFTNEQINTLSDEDMQRIADTVNNRNFLFFEEDVKFAVWEELKERGIDNQTEGGRDEWS